MPESTAVSVPFSVVNHTTRLVMAASPFFAITPILYGNPIGTVTESDVYPLSLRSWMDGGNVSFPFLQAAKMTISAKYMLILIKVKKGYEF
jgi:hypothetical protein